MSSSEPSLDKILICVSGLPRSGSTLVCQLLGQHPDIYSPGHSSPLLPAITLLQSQLSDNDFLLSQLDHQFEFVYQRLLNAYRGFINGWFAETEKSWVVDKHRGWVNSLDLALHLVPNCRMVVCVRELGQIYGSIENQHQNTLLLDFPDHLANLSPYERCDRLFAPQGVVGSPLRAIQSIQDRNQQQQKQLFFVVFEHLMTQPLQVMKELFNWLNLDAINIDPQNLMVRPHEADSYYRFKYPHQTYSKINPPQYREISTRIELELRSTYRWFYELFYPGLIKNQT
ncbi:sulfotransferase [Microcoleus sp. F10_A2]|uniref:sulfotransferase n=1 Tax=unclassified Microcoleus TaxID=2642155 RepID=UPI002FCF8C7C